MEEVLSGETSWDKAPNKVSPSETLFQKPVSLTPHAVIQILCPTPLTQAWLEHAIVKEQHEGLLPPHAYQITPLFQWLNTHFPNMSLADQCASLKNQLLTDEVFTKTPILVYGTPFLPEVFQDLALSLNQAWGIFFKNSQIFHPPSPTSLGIRKELATEDPAFAASVILNELYHLQKAHVSSTNILILCPNTLIQDYWKEKLRFYNIPIWGDEDPNLIHEVALLNKTLHWCQQALIIPDVSFEEAFSQPETLEVFQSILQAQGILPPPRETPLSELSKNISLAPLLQNLKHHFELFKSDSTWEAWTQLLKSSLFQGFSPDLQRFCIDYTLTSQTKQLPVPQTIAELRASIERLQPQLLFNPNTQGVSVFTLQESGGMAIKNIILPQAHHFFTQPQNDETIKQLNAQLALGQHILATYNPEELLWDEMPLLEFWLKGWEKILPESLELTSETLTPSNTNTPWTDFTPGSKTLVMEPDEPVMISPSSLDTYLKCPRKFFYQSLLGLKEKTTSPQAALGSLIHKILEVFNQHFQNNYTFEELIILTQKVFQWETEADYLTSLGFEKKDFTLLQQISPLYRHQLHTQIQQAFTDLRERGYFNTSFEPVGIEKPIFWSNIPGIENITLYGRADLIRKGPGDTLEIVDYKTTRQKYLSVKLETNMKPLFKALEPIDWAETNRLQRYGEREYQLPLYWLMAQHTHEFQNKKINTSLQLVRPPKQNGKTGGCETLTLPHEALEQGKTNLLTLLKKGLAEPIQGCKDFPPLGNKQKHCAYCPYVNLCEGPQGDEETDEGDFE